MSDFRVTSGSLRQAFLSTLQQAQQHDRHQAARMQRIGRRVEADIGVDRPLGGEIVQRLAVGALMDETAFGGGFQEFRARCRHCLHLSRFQGLLPAGGGFITLDPGGQCRAEHPRKRDWTGRLRYRLDEWNAAVPPAASSKKDMVKRFLINDFQVISV